MCRMTFVSVLRFLMPPQPRKCPVCAPGADRDEFGQQTPDVPPLHLLQLPVHITREEGRQRGPSG